MRKVDDLRIKEVFEEALLHDNTLMLSEVILIEKKGFFSKPKEVSHFTVYHECFSQDGKPAYQARQQSSASGSNDIVIAYLYGIINGSLAHLKRLPCPTSPTQNS